MSFSIISYNIRKGLGAHHHKPAFLALSDELKEQNADVIMCQEVAEQYQKTSFSQSHTLSQVLDHHHHYAANAFYDRGNHGNAIFSKHPIVSSKNHDISTNPIEQRGLLHTIINVEGHPHPVHLINTHFGLTPWQRRKQCRRLIQLIKDTIPEHEPLLIAGDFNDFSGHVKRTLTKSGIVSCALSHLKKNQQKTWPSHKPLFCLDRIFYRNVEVIQSTVLKKKAWQRLSDHLPIRTVFKLLTPKTANAPA